MGLGLAGLTTPALAVATAAPVPPAPPPGPAERAKERCCQVELDGPARTVTAGGAPASFDLVVSRTARGCTQTQRTITVRLDGLAAKHVRLERVVSGQMLALRDSSPEDGTVEAVDPLVDSKLICGEDGAVASYRLAFLDGSPSGRAELVVAALAINGKLLDSAKATTVVLDPTRTSAPPTEETTPPAPVTEAPAEETTAPAAVAETPGTDAVARPPLDPASDNVLTTTLLTAAIVFAFAAMLLLGVLWRLRRGLSPVTADEAPTATLPPGIGAELARLTEDRGAADPTRPAAPL